MKLNIRQSVFEQSLQQFIQPDWIKHDLSVKPDHQHRRGLDRRQRSMLRKKLNQYRVSTDLNIRQLQNEVNGAFIHHTKGIGAIFARGMGLGVSAAGIVNTVAPGLFSTSLGYIAGSLKGTSVMSSLTKLGLVSAGVFTPPAFTSGAILLIGGVIGTVLYAVYRGIKRLFTGPRYAPGHRHHDDR